MSTQISLLDCVPPEGPRDGVTFQNDRDGSRLNRQQRAVWEIVRDGAWHTLAEIAAATGEPEASLSARLRDLRKAKFGGFRVERRYVENGLWSYRVMRPE